MWNWILHSLKLFQIETLRFILADTFVISTPNALIFKEPLSEHRINSHNSLVGDIPCSPAREVCTRFALAMMTSSNGNISALLAICAGNSPVSGELPAQRPVTRSFDVSFDLRLNKRLSKQWWDWWFQTLSRPFWRHCNSCFVLIWQWSISPYIWEFHDCDWANVIVAPEKVPRRILCLDNSLNDINTHYCDAIMGTVASQITRLTIVYTAVYSDADQSKHQSSASLAFVWGIHRDRWIPRTKGQLRGKCFHLMTSSCR